MVQPSIVSCIFLFLPLCWHSCFCPAHHGRWSQKCTFSLCWNPLLSYENSHCSFSSFLAICLSSISHQAFSFWETDSSLTWPTDGMWSIIQFWDSELCGSQLFRGCTPLLQLLHKCLVSSHNKRCPIWKMSQGFKYLLCHKVFLLDYQTWEEFEGIWRNFLWNWKGSVSHPSLWNSF